MTQVNDEDKPAGPITKVVDLGAEWFGSVTDWPLILMAPERR